MTSALATIRPDSWNFPLLLHVAGATILFGAVVTGAAAALTADRTSHPELLRRVAFRSLLIVGLPAYILMRVGAQWIYSKENLDDAPEDPTWLAIGFTVADLGLLVFLAALALSGIAVRRGQSGLAKASGVLAAILAVALVVAVWAMGAKPS
jgi:cytochrome b561